MTIYSRETTENTFISTNQFGIGTLVLGDIYLFYDIPLLFSCRNSLGHTFLIRNITITETDELWMILPVSTARIQQLQTKTISLLDAIQNAEGGYVYLMNGIGFGSETPTITQQSCTDLDHRYLPTAEFFLDHHESVPQKITLEYTDTQGLPIQLSGRLTNDQAQLHTIQHPHINQEYTFHITVETITKR